MTDAALYHAWQFETAADATAMVYPDGCRDVLVITGTQGESELRLTDWDFKPRQVALRAGTRIAGYRLRPGTSMSAQAVGAMAAGADSPEDWIEAHAITSDEAIDALLEPGSTVHGTAKNRRRDGQDAAVLVP